MGERFWRLLRSRFAERRAMVVVVTSGGARMQKLFSLMQMAKTVVVTRILAEAHLPFVTVLTHPTRAGVRQPGDMADVIIAEPGAVMQFAGEDHRADDARKAFRQILDLGIAGAARQVDMVVDRRELRGRLAWTLRLLETTRTDGRTRRNSISPTRSYQAERRVLQRLQSCGTCRPFPVRTTRRRSARSRVAWTRYGTETPR